VRYVVAYVNDVMADVLNAFLSDVVIFNNAHASIQ
jgi:hypothetical protein